MVVDVVVLNKVALVAREVVVILEPTEDVVLLEVVAPARPQPLENLNHLRIVVFHRSSHITVLIHLRDRDSADVR